MGVALSRKSLEEHVPLDGRPSEQAFRNEDTKVWHRLPDHPKL
jgi:hypothetical protein